MLTSSLDELLMGVVELACTLLYNAGLSSPFFGMLAPPSPFNPLVLYFSHPFQFEFISRLLSVDF
jgi:hypothetical protein